MKSAFEHGYSENALFFSIPAWGVRSILEAGYWFYVLSVINLL